MRLCISSTSSQGGFAVDNANGPASLPGFSPLEATPGSRANKEWTFMVYIDGDNNLEGAAVDDFLEMSAVGSTGDVNIVVQMDRRGGYDTSYGDWRDCQRYLVTQGMTPTEANAVSDWGDGQGGREVNMGDPNAAWARVSSTCFELRKRGTESSGKL